MTNRAGHSITRNLRPHKERLFLLLPDLKSRIKTGSYGRHPRMGLDFFPPVLKDGTHWSPEAGGPLRPTIVFLYGGGWKKGSRHFYRPLGLALARAGFAVAIADYRLYPEVRFPAFMEDVAAALSWVHAWAADFGGDAGDIRLMGHSAGAHMGALLCLDPAWLQAENLDPAIIRSFIGLAGPYTANMMRAGSYAPIFDPAEDKARTRPIKMLCPERIMPRSLLLHGCADRTVARRNSETFARAITELGGDAETEFYKGVGHVGLLTTLAPGLRWRAPAWDTILDFLGK